MTNISMIRQKILEQAFRGNLVARNEDDEPVVALLSKIQKEREALIRGKIIKNQKPILPPVQEDEFFYDLPEGWNWVRLRDICYNFGQKKPDGEFSYIDVTVIDGVKGVITNGVKVIEPKDAPSRARKIVKNGTVIYSTVRPYLRNIAIVDREFEFEVIASTAFAILHAYEGINNKFIYFYLRSDFMKKYVESKMVGVAYPAINESEFFMSPFPLPPYEEQERIVKKIEELFSLCDQWEREVEFQQKHTAIVREKVLADALQGILVSQSDEDEPASVLLKRVHEEKEELIKSKKMKKEKPLPSITSEEKIFELPSGWEWVRLGEVIQLISGQHVVNADYNQNGEGIPYLTGPTDFGEIHTVISKWTTKPKVSVNKGDILITVKGSGVGKINILSEDASIGRQLMAVQNIIVNQKFLWYILYSNKSNFQSKKVGIAIPGISREDVLELVIALPPLEEQKRIVDKVDKIWEAINEIESSIVIAK
ncbi:restriction endonuclease subunit S [Lysinibacillus boronitolerans]|uniref:restriction endonuclease subunit S n=1 Tax=Lysinibacillus boronitolerans TaxID=309788 RepID=UPI0038522EC0